MNMPLPTGRYAVGTFTYTVMNDRPEALEPSVMRSVASRVYYPVPKDRVQGCAKAKYLSRNMAESTSESPFMLLLPSPAGIVSTVGSFAALATVSA